MLYQVTALGSTGSIVRLEIDANDLDAVRRQAESRSLRVLSATPRAKHSVRALMRRRFPLTLFTQELLALLKAGIGIVESLDALSGKAENPDDAAVMTGVLRALHEGLPLSDALERFPDAFSDALHYFSPRQRTHRRSGRFTVALSGLRRAGPGYPAQGDQCFDLSRDSARFWILGDPVFCWGT